MFDPAREADFQGPIPLQVDKALDGDGHNTHAHRQLYLSGHSVYNPYIDSMTLTQAGRDYHVQLLLNKL